MHLLCIQGRTFKNKQYTTSMFLQGRQFRDKPNIRVFQHPSQILWCRSCKISQWQLLFHLNISHLNRSTLQWNHKIIASQETIRDTKKQLQYRNKINVHKTVRSELDYKLLQINRISNKTSIKVIRRKLGNNKTSLSRQDHTSMQAHWHHYNWYIWG